MSHEVVSLKIKRTCEGCGAVVEWELINSPETTISEMQGWYTVIREIFVEDRFVKMMVQACSLACVPAAAVKLALPPQDTSIDNIDIASLRAGSQLN